MVCFFGNSQQAFIAALKPRTCCISETRDPDTRVSLLSGNYLKGLIFWKRDSCFFFFCFFLLFFLEKDKHFSRALEIPVFIILCWLIDDTAHPSRSLSHSAAGSDRSFSHCRKRAAFHCETPTRGHKLIACGGEPHMGCAATWMRLNNQSGRQRPLWVNITSVG